MSASNFARPLRFANRHGLLVGASAAALFLGSVVAVNARNLGGGSSPSAATSAAAIAAAAAQAGAQQGSATAQQAIASMARAAQALDGLRAAQSAARAAALIDGSAVPNGLVPGGMVVGPGAGTVPDVWVGASKPTQSASGGRTQVEIKQTEQKAILNWSSFNIGRETDVYFNQTAGGTDANKWIALNRVTDPSLAPSRILGTIKAEGQVYIINKNGIVFGGASQVNVNSFVASSLSLSDEQFRAGINNQLFVFNDGSGNGVIAKPQFGYLGQQKPIDFFLGLHDPGQTPGVDIGAAPGDITIEAGARVAMASGGKALIFAPRVTNNGRISAPDGQVIMAAGEQVYLATDVEGVRGLTVAVTSPMRWVFDYNVMMSASGQGNNTSGAQEAFVMGIRDEVMPEMAARAASVGYRVVNNGMVSADHGNITLMSRSIVQNGALEAPTALNNREGSIRLRAWDQGMLSYGSSISAGSPLRYWSTGTLTLGSGSVTTAMPDLTDTSEIEQTSLATRYSPGMIEMRGKLIDIEANANVIVPAGKISVVASTSALSGETPISGEPVKRDGSRVYIGEGAYLSVAGLQGMLLTMESNVVTGEMRINELRDSPLYRDSWLRGKTVSVDKRVSGLFSDGPMAGVEWISGSPGAWVGTPLGDFSGWIGVGKTTLGELSTKAGSIAIKSSGSIVTRQGSLLDVSGGSVRYQDGWITTTRLLGADGRLYDIGAAMPDQVYVGFAGSFARTHNVQGKMDARLTETWTSVFDRGMSRRFERGYTEGQAAGKIQMFAAEGIVLEGSYWGGVITGERQSAQGKSAAAGSFTFGGNSDEHRQWLIGNLVIGKNPELLPAGFTATSTLDPIWYAGSPTDDLSVRKKTTYLDPEILAQSGMSKLAFYVAAGFNLAKDEHLELTPGSAFNVFANTGTNNPASFTIDGSVRIAGGEVWFAGAGSSNYGSTASIDVSGDWYNGARNGLPPVIKGGRVTVTGDFAPGASFDVSGGGWYDITGIKPKLKLGDAGTLTLGPTDVAQLASLDLRGYSGASGGTLAVVTSGSVVIGGHVPSNPAIGWLPPSLFAERGFRSFALTTAGDVTVTAGTTISLLPVNLDFGAIDAANIASGTRLAALGKLTVLPLQERNAAAATSLSLTGSSVTVEAGVDIAVDVGGAITVAAVGHPGSTGQQVAGQVVIHGRLEAPAGAISVSNNLGAIEIADNAELFARGAAVIAVDRLGLRTGKVLDGGTVSITAPDVKMASGALIDVSGSSAVIDIAGGAGKASTQSLASNGGSIKFEVGNGTIAGRLLGNPGGPGAIGGTIAINVPGGGGSPAAALKQIMGTLDPDCFGLGSGVCDNNWEDTIGFDWGWLLGSPESMIFTRAMVDALPDGSKIVISRAATGGGAGPLPDPRNFGWSDASLDLIAMYGWDVRAAFASAAAVGTLNVHQRSVEGGGFANLSLQTGGTLVLDNANLNFSRSIAVIAPIASAGAGTATITAPYVSFNGPASAAGVAGAGRIVVSADLIDVTGATFKGFAEAELMATDLRLGGLQGDLTTAREAALSADGRLVLRVGQIYPATGIIATISAGSELVIERRGDAALPLSAAGTLKLQAPVIAQNGTVRAPFGSIVFNATDSITLGAGSITSVSGDGLIIPYGTLSNNEFWVDPVSPPLADGTRPSLSKLPAKNIVLQGPRVALAAGSVVDIRGGGDLYAWEPVPGPGGSHDMLAQSGVYAILPGMNVSGAAQQKVWLAGGNGLAAGWYALLPARYALLPGAFAVSMVKGSTSARPSAAITRPDGSTTMSGYRADIYGGGYDQLASTWRVMSGDVVRSYSEYNEAFANTYFVSDAFKLSQYRLTGVNVVTPRLAIDGGSVVFKATTDLVLDGQLQSRPAPGGRGGLVDIAGTKIAVLGAGQDRSDLTGYLVIDSRSLSNFGAGSLLVGGIRSDDPRGLRIDVTASDVVVRNDAGNALTGSEVLLAASNRVAIDDGSVVSAQGAAQADGVDLVMAPQVKAVYGDPGGGNDGNPNNDILLSPSRDYGALIRVSTGNAVKVLRENVDTTTGGVVAIGAGATLAGGSALLIDATRDTIVAGSARLSGAALSLASGRIGFGGGSTGLVLDAASLAQLADTQALTLRSYSTMEFYTSVNLGSAGLRTVTFDAAGLVGYGTGAITVSGGTIALENSSGTFSSPGAVGNVLLSLNADEIVLGGGAKALRGFDAVSLNAGRQITGQGTGSLDAGTAAVTMNSPVITGRGGASQSIETQNVLRVIGGGNTPIENAEASLGTRFALTGTSVDFGGRIVALGGAVNLIATAGNVTIGTGSLIDVGGFRKQFFDVAQFADAGSIALTAVGSVIVAPGGHLNLSAHAEGGAAGRLSMTASNGGTVVLGGLIEARAAAGQTGGSFALDIAALPDFAGMSQILNESGFTASRQFRIRSGNVVIDGVTQVANFSLVADQGTVTLAGIIDARAPYGGSIAVSAGNGLTMLGSALLQAGATGEFGGGRVTLEASGGQLDIRGGTIDVAGADGGRVRFRALQNLAHDEIAVANLQVGIIGARSSVLEGVSVYNSGSVDAVRGDAIADANTFAGHAAAIAARLNAGGIAVMPGIEIRSTGDLVLETDWNLASDFVSARMGGLTLRAGGNLTILGNLSDGFSAADRSGVLQDMASWDLRLVSGADLASANALAVSPLAAQAANSGNLSIGDATSGRIVRTGTGDIDVVAGRNLLLAHNTSAVYTAGRADPTVYADFQPRPGATYGIDGGHLRISTQGSATSVLPVDPDDNQLFTEWLRKIGSLDLNFVFETGHQSSWWIDYGAFQQGVGALGGGNVSVTTGGDLVNMLVALPTNGRVRGGRTSGEAMQLELRNGGLMQVAAGGAVRAGYFYVGRGDGVITAGEFANGRTVSAQLTAQLTDVYNIAPVIALGDAAMKVKTTGDLILQTVMDPLLLNSDNFYLGGGSRYTAYMSGYTDRTSLDLVSVGGDVSLTNQGRFLSKQLDVSGGSYLLDMDYSVIGIFATNLYPSITRIAALNGSITNQNRMFTTPGANAEFRLLAETDVVLGDILVSRANRDMMPTPLRPFGGVGGGWLQLRMRNTPIDFQSIGESGFVALLLNQLQNGQSISDNMLFAPYFDTVRNPEHLINEADTEPSRIFARSGSIVGSLIATSTGPKLGRVVTGEQTWFRAGTDIRNIDYNLRNLHRTDVSLLEAGNDIIGGSIDIQGPGAISLAAGRDVYGRDFQIYSRGNYDAYTGSNRAVELSEVKGLARDGAAISVMAGLQGQQISYDAFAAAYLDPGNMAAMPDYLKATSLRGEYLPIYMMAGIDVRSATVVKIQRGLQLFVAEMTGELLSPLDAWSRFRSLPLLTQQRFIREAYINELRAAGDNQLTLDAEGRPLNGGYRRGYTAIETLFPGDAWKGDIKIGNATFRTMAGGAIETLTPGGGLQVAALGTVVNAGAGLVTLGYGDINIFARDSVTVNRSRVLTFAGGDVTIWSTLGDIDAGRGAKTTRVPSAPEITTDEDAVTKVQEKADIGGSGIGTIIGFTGVEPGDVSLIAPEGTVDAGDAGIRVSGNFVVAALQVLNAENIKVDGDKKGLPKVESVSLNMTVQSKDKAADDAVKETTQSKANERPSVIIVEVLGYGGAGAADQATEKQGEDEEKRRREQPQQHERRSDNYDQSSPVQVLGAGELTDMQTEALIYQKKKLVR